ncbi:hypothetical protein WJX84_006971 [Apatococcus fuscideae]|uniref:DUF1329 domain-containing protein n=1 Tax=Apatococcus fuscideae TaxID=2026836 RepID=A0AAW1T1F2_9CHLO
MSTSSFHKPLLYLFVVCSCQAGLQRCSGSDLATDLTSKRQGEATAAPRRQLVTFDEQGFWKPASQHLTAADQFLFRDACVQKAWTADKLVVVAGKRYETSWLQELEPFGVQHIVYQNSDPAEPNYFEPYANEAGAYFLFILNHYHCLPSYIAFIHGHRDEGWHQVEMPTTLRSLEWEQIPGYVDLNRKAGYKQITLDHKGRLPPLEPIATGKEVYNGSFSTYQILEGRAYPFWMMHLYLHEIAFARAWDHFFGPQGFGPLPEKVVHICCGQFAATSKAIMGRSQEFYQEALLYMRPQNNDIRGNHKTNRQYVVGDMFSVFYDAQRPPMTAE